VVDVLPEIIAADCPDVADAAQKGGEGQNAVFNMGDIRIAETPGARVKAVTGELK
jgi:hypothetical protein